MLQTINTETVKVLFSLELVSEEEINELKERALEEQKKAAISKLGKSTNPPTTDNRSKYFFTTTRA